MRKNTRVISRILLVVKVIPGNTKKYVHTRVDVLQMSGMSLNMLKRANLRMLRRVKAMNGKRRKKRNTKEVVHVDMFVRLHVLLLIGINSFEIILLILAMRL